MGAPTTTKKKADPVRITAQPGPQSDFLSTNADICIFGGSAFGGKSVAALLDHIRWTNRRGYAGLILRRVGKNLTGPGSIWEKSKAFFGPSGGHYREGSYLDWRWKSGAFISFDHCQYDSDAETKYQGQEYDVVTFEELTHFTEYQFWYLWGRLRSNCGIRPYLRATCNPDPDSFVRKLIDWWIDPDTGYAIKERSGALRYWVRDDEGMHWGDTPEEVADARGVPVGSVKSLTFIRSSLEDNKIGVANDPEYASKLEALPLIERERLRGGNWNIRREAGNFFNSAWFNRLVEGRMEYAIGRVRGWDLAATEPKKGNKKPDFTASVLMARDREGRTRVEDCNEVQLGPTDVERLMFNTAMLDGKSTLIALFQDPAQAGKAQAERLKFEFAALGYEVVVLPSSTGKTAYARPFAKAVEEGYRENTDKVTLVADAWTQNFIGRHHKFTSPDSPDDLVDAGSAAFTVLEKRFPYVANPLKNIMPTQSIYRKRTYI